MFCIGLVIKTKPVRYFKVSVNVSISSEVILMMLPLQYNTCDCTTQVTIYRQTVLNLFVMYKITFYKLNDATKKSVQYH